MKKAEIIKSKHVDHIENEKNILEKIQHPFVVSAPAAPHGPQLLAIRARSEVDTQSSRTPVAPKISKH